MEIVECSPPYDHAEQTSTISARGGPRLFGQSDSFGQARQDIGQTSPTGLGAVRHLALVHLTLVRGMMPSTRPRL
jgi:hypothetical protein